MRGRAGAIAPVQNLHQSQNSGSPGAGRFTQQIWFRGQASSVRPAPFQQRPSRPAGNGGVLAPASVIERLPFNQQESRQLGSASWPAIRLGRPAGALTHPLFLAPFTEPIARPWPWLARGSSKRRWRRGKGSGAMAPVQNLLSTTIRGSDGRGLPRYTMKSMGNTTGLGPGAGVVVLRRFPVTLSPQRRGFGRRSRSTCGLRDSPAPSPTPSSWRLYRADRSPAALVGARLGKRRWGRERAPSAKTCTARQSRPNGEACRINHEEHG